MKTIMINEEVKNHLITEAKKYDAEDYNLFESELGWEDWMNDFTESEDGEEASESEINNINNELKKIFKEAHN